MGESEHDEDMVDENVCEKCHSHEVEFIENEFIMGRVLKKYVCENCGSKFFVTDD